MYFYTIFNGFLIFKLYVGSYVIQVLKIPDLPEVLPALEKEWLFTTTIAAITTIYVYETSFRKFRHNFHLVLCSDIIQE